MGVRLNPGYQAGRHFRRRYPDMYTAPNGTVHPIRASAGYSELEERAGNVKRERERRLEDEEESYHAGQRIADAARGYEPLRDAIRSEGGIRSDRDYPPSTIPRDLYSPRGVPPDEMPLRLQAHGFHYDGAEEMLSDIRKRRRAVETLGKLKRAG